MNLLDELALVSNDQRRIELAKLLATGVIRLLIQQQRDCDIDNGDSDETFSEGLDDS